MAQLANEHARKQRADDISEPERTKLSHAPTEIRARASERLQAQDSVSADQTTFAITDPPNRQGHGPKLRRQSISRQLGETLRRDQPHSFLLAMRESGGDGIGVLRGSTQSLTTIEIRGSSRRFSDEGFWTIPGDSSARDFPSGDEMRNTLSIEFDSRPQSSGSALTTVAARRTRA